jgi:hypothetical protein
MAIINRFDLSLNPRWADEKNKAEAIRRLQK